MKKLNYVNMNCITWGAVRELIEENNSLKNKVEHLEATMYEMMQDIKELKNPKPKKQSKSKSKSEKYNSRILNLK